MSCEREVFVKEAGHYISIDAFKNGASPTGQPWDPYTAMTVQNQQIKDRQDHKPQHFLALGLCRNIQKVIGML